MVMKRDPQKALAREEARRAKLLAKEEAARAKEEEREAKAFAASPQGRARAAREAGEQLFQISLPVSATEKSFVGDSVMLGAPTATKTRDRDVSGPLALIESEGWRLDHVGYVFRPTGTQSRDRLLATGQVETIMGEVVGIYLFRASDEH
jgi:hypothetical protein